MNPVERARALRPVIEQNAESMTDTAALDSPELFANWRGDCVAYDKGQRLRYAGVLYRVLIAHTSQPDWAPDVAASLFAKVLIPDENTVYPWEQPDSTNPYMKGDKVTHNGETWASTIDNNVWEPGVYGWEVVAAE